MYRLPNNAEALWFRDRNPLKACWLLLHDERREGVKVRAQAIAISKNYTNRSFRGQLRHCNYWSKVVWQH